MGERMLRGSRLGAVSYESDRNTELAPRQTREYLCAKGHQFEVPFAVDAEVPTTWECKFDGSVARLVDGSEPEQKKAKPPRTHWDMLLERRSIAELEDILEEHGGFTSVGDLRQVDGIGDARYEQLKDLVTV
ncbi:RNA polymerase-binding protein RbpA [Micromonospora chokoriensis]